MPAGPPVIRDITELPTRHPDVAREFIAGNFTIQNTNRVFSAIPTDQGHELNKRVKRVRRRVVGKAAVPGNWQNFLRAERNETELFSFLSKVLLQAFCKEDNEVVLTDRKGCSAHSYTPAPFSNEEADSRMLLHVSHAAQHGHHQMPIRTVDTDGMVLVFAINHLPAGCELWLPFGTGKSFCYLTPTK